MVVIILQSAHASYGAKLISYVVGTSEFLLISYAVGTSEFFPWL